MDTSDIVMIVGCLVIGYALVSMAMRKPGPPPAAPKPPPAFGGAQQPPPGPPPLPHWATVLELAPDAGVDEIRDAYRRLISQYHPDKVASLGRELQELAEAKSKAISIAYQEALAERRMTP